MTLGIIPNTVLLAACIAHFIGPPLDLIYLLSPSHAGLPRISYCTNAVSYLLYMVSAFVWGRDLWRRFKGSRGKAILMETTELICIVYCSIFFAWSIFAWLHHKSTVWRDAGESILWPMMMVQILCIVPMTIIPGRVSSADARSRLQMLSQKQAFVRFVSHEIRSPLSIVAAGLDIFVERLAHEGTTTLPSSSSSSSSSSATAASCVPPTPNTNQSELLELANDLSEATDMAINILNDLLQYESMDAGMFKLEAARVDPADLFKAKALGIIAKRHSLSLDVVPPAVEDGVFVLADVYRVEQVVRNLVTNACKFTPAGGTITINTEVVLSTSTAAAPAATAAAAAQGARGGRRRRGRRNGSNSLSHGAHPPPTPTPLEKSFTPFATMRAGRCGSLRVKVNDTGVGIQDHNKDKLFQQFEQFDKNKLQAGGGSGLGLWISHFIIDCHGGKLQFESHGPGKGSVFFFDLPLYQQQQQQQQQQPSTTTRPKPMLEFRHYPSTADVEGQTLASLGSFGEHNIPIPDAGAQISGAAGTSVDSYTLLKAHPASIQIPALGAITRDSEAFDNGADSATHGTAPEQVSYLLVDDSKGNRRMLRRMLESDKSILVSSIQEAEDGVEALALVAEAGSAPDKPPIDCIFMDSVMKQMHGPETVRHLRGKLGFTGMILGLTGNAMEDDVKHFKQAGLDLLLIKPLRKAGLIEALVAHGLMTPLQPAPLEAPPSECRAAAREDNIDDDTEVGEASNYKSNGVENNDRIADRDAGDDAE